MDISDYFEISSNDNESAFFVDWGLLGEDNWFSVSDTHAYLCNAVSAELKIRIGDVVMVGPVGSIDATSPMCDLYTVREVLTQPLCAVDQRFVDLYLRRVKPHHAHRYAAALRNLVIVSGYKRRSSCVFSSGVFDSDIFIMPNQPFKQELTDFIQKAVENTNVKEFVVITSRPCASGTPWYEERYDVAHASKLFDRVVNNDFDVDSYLKIGV